MKICVYLTGGIAVYKAVEVVRKLEKLGHEVRVVMTKNSEKFISTMTLASLTKYPVLDDLWIKENEATIPHVHLARWTELAIVVPATANFIAKAANGLADDAASTTFLATSAPKVIIPAMNDQMWLNPATQRNLETLKTDGIQIMSPSTGLLAEGYCGKGRMPEPDQIIAWVKKYIDSRNNLKGKKIVVTAGGTLEAIDPVRFIGNRSSGKMGIAIAEAARNQGAEVVLIYGNISVKLPAHVKCIHTESAIKMKEKVLEEFQNADALFMAAAVADWRIAAPADHKLKKSDDQNEMVLKLTKNPDILQAVGKMKNPHQKVIGFAAETDNLLQNAQTKLKKKNVDYLIANNVAKGVFGSDLDQVIVLSKDNEPKKWPQLSKKAIASRLLALL